MVTHPGGFKTGRARLNNDKGGQSGGAFPLLACLPSVEYIKTSSLLAANLKNIAFHCNVEVDFNKTPESKYLIQSFPNSKLSIYRLNVKLFLPMLCPSVRRIHDDLPVSGCIGREIWFQSSLSN